MENFRGSFRRLRKKVRSSGVNGQWTEIKNGHQFRSENGAILNWNSETGVMQYQGHEEALDKLKSALAKTQKNVDSRKKIAETVKNVWFRPNWAGIGVFISILALLTAVHSAYETRKQARLSVRPHIMLHFSANDKGAGWLRTISGAGPAIINAFEVTVDGKAVQTWDSVMAACGINLRVPQPGRLAIPTPGTYLLPGTDTTRPLLWLEAPVSRAALVKNAHRVQLKMVYCSLYDECWERSLSELEPIPTHKRKPILQFGVSQAWREGLSQSPE